MKTILIATRNQHKIEEIHSILPKGIRWLSLRDYPQAPEVLEDANSFRGNAAKKADSLVNYLYNRPSDWRESYVLADDSGLEVDALEGAPGVHSARFANLNSDTVGNAPDDANTKKLLNLLGNVAEANRTARFRCVLALMPLRNPNNQQNCPTAIDPETEFFVGACEGRILKEPRGTMGFGYDPVFAPLGFDQSFAELGEQVKNRLSHRAAALQKLNQWFTQPHPL